MVEGIGRPYHQLEIPIPPDFDHPVASYGVDQFVNSPKEYEEYLLEYVN